MRQRHGDVGGARLNRALLARQHLLDRVDLPITDAVVHLVGLQAQATPPPYHGLHARLKRFDPDALGALIADGTLVRMTLMRATVHLVTRRDAARLRPLVQPVIERNHRGAFGRRMGAFTPERIAAEAPAHLPDTAREVARALGAEDEEAIANAVRTFTPTYQRPPRGILGVGGKATLARFEDPLEPPDLPGTILRYLRAFGPATVKDFQSWSGLTRTKPAFAQLELEELAPGLYDVPDGPRPDPETPAPPRFLGEYDNVLLGHADRSRIIPADFPWGAMLAHGRYVNNLLVDGTLRATWWLEDDVIAVRPHGEIPRAEVEAEAARFPWARDIRFEPALPSSA